MKIILLRHGESKWNLENRFTGWKDVELTSNGENEALFAANQLIDNNLKIQTVHTSLLKRATQTAKIVSNIIGFPYNKVQQDWRLNERHYGALQGLNKAETALQYGEDQVQLWRRSYDISPPLLSNDDPRNPKFDKKFNSINTKLPLGESLKDVIVRLTPFLKTFFSEIKGSDSNHLIVAHSNSLRAIIKVLDNLSEKEIVSINIPTGVPLVYSLLDNLKVENKKYLIKSDELKKKQNIIANQGKIK
jgi:2,3-bisphosphoglycerate-dependent phosphoglycerate mutase